MMPETPYYHGDSFRGMVLTLAIMASILTLSLAQGGAAAPGIVGLFAGSSAVRWSYHLWRNEIPHDPEQAASVITHLMYGLMAGLLFTSLSYWIHFDDPIRAALISLLPPILFWAMPRSRDINLEIYDQ